MGKVKVVSSVIVIAFVSILSIIEESAAVNVGAELGNVGCCSPRLELKEMLQ